MTPADDGSTGMLTTIDGFPYDSSVPVLLIRTPRSRLTFDLRLTCAGPELRSRLSAAVPERLAADMPICVYADFIAVKAFVEASAAAAGGVVAQLTLADFCVAAAAGPASSVKALVFGLRRMGALLGPAMEPSLRREIATIRGAVRGRRPGDARAPGDANAPLSEAEYAELAASLARRLAAREITAADHALAVLAATMFPRPTQIALLKVEDLVQVGWSDGQPVYKLKVARIKQRGKAFASSFTMRTLDPDMGSLLAAQCGRATLEVAADAIPWGKAPMFPGEPTISVLGTAFPQLAGYVRHMAGTDVTVRIRNVLGVNSRCARTTIATMMRANNRSYRQIGMILDNTPAAARSYVDHTPEMVARVERKLGAALTPLADLFLGRPGGRVPSLDPPRDPPVSVEVAISYVYRPVGSTRAARLRDLEERARGSWLLSGPALPYDAEVWDVTEALPKSVGPAKSRTRQRLWFSASPSHHGAKPMQPIVIGLAKIYVRLNSEGLGPSAIRERLYAVRHLGDALAEAGAESIEDCTLETFDRALAIAIGTLGVGSAYKVATQLEALAKYMGFCRLTKVPVGTWRHTAPVPALPDGSAGPEFHARASKLLPTDGFLIACAKAFQLSSSVSDVIVSSVLALLGCAQGGTRIGEVLRLRENARTGRGLILPGSKGAAEHDGMVLSSMAELADIAMERLLDVTADARAIKRDYDEDPTRLSLPPGFAHLRGKPLLTMAEAAALLGQTPGCAFHKHVRNNGFELVGGALGDRAAGHRLSFAAVERHVLSRLGEHMRLAGGRDYHPLLIVRWRQFRSATGCPCMFESFGYQKVFRSIRPFAGRASMFQRQGIDPDGTATGDTKSFRHFINTLAQLVDLSPEDIAEFSGRLGTGHNRNYDHTPPEAPLDDLEGFSRHQERNQQEDENEE